MLAHRIIPVVLYRGQETVKGTEFSSWRSVGHVRQAVRVYESRNIDELILLDVGATPEGHEPDFELIRDLAGELFCPVTVGGGVRTVEHFQKALANGADKVLVGLAARDNPSLITDAAKRFGSQAVVVAVNHLRDPVSSLRAVEQAIAAAYAGAGEIVLNCISSDGMMHGYDLETIRDTARAVSVPVVAMGGCGSYQHMAEALRSGADAVASGAMFLFEDATPAQAAEYLYRQHLPVRRDASG